MIARARRVSEYVQYVRERGYLLEVGPLQLTTIKEWRSGERNAFELGRDYERSLKAGERA